MKNLKTVTAVAVIVAMQFVVTAAPARAQQATVDNTHTAALGWGGNPVKAAKYINVYSKQNDGKTAYTLTAKDVPVNGFWSISLYNGKGYFVQNDSNAYSINNITSKKNKDGSITIHFGGDPKQSNYLPIMGGWNYTVRLYQPQKEILDGKWKFPEPQPVK